MTWANALSYCEGLSLGGHSDWRLPNVKELASITDDTRSTPAIDTTYFPNAQPIGYWSSTTSSGDTRIAIVVDFNAGNVGGGNNKSNVGDAYYRCVSSGKSGLSCNLAISLTSQIFTSTGGTGSITVTASDSACAWTAASSLDWVTITSGNSGTGSGTVSYSVLDNTVLSSRRGTLTIAGQTFTVNQSGTSASCSGGAVNLQNVTFLSGQTYNCVATTSITAGTGVTVQNGATVNFISPIINLQPGFTVESGAVFNMRQ